MFIIILFFKNYIFIKHSTDINFPNHKHTYTFFRKKKRLKLPLLQTVIFIYFFFLQTLDLYIISVNKFNIIVKATGSG